MPPVFLSHCNREMGSVKMQLLVLGVLFVYVNGKYTFMGTKDIKIVKIDFLILGRAANMDKRLCLPTKTIGNQCESNADDNVGLENSNTKPNIDYLVTLGKQIDAETNFEKKQELSRYAILIYRITQRIEEDQNRLQYFTTY